jgi:hypothetical protein
MADPVTWTVLGSWAAAEGIKFLYGQANELIKAWRERHRQREAGQLLTAELSVPVIATDALDGAPADPVVDAELLDKEKPALSQLVGDLTLYVQDGQNVDIDDADLANYSGQLRAILEALYGQRFTFQGEDRDPTGTKVSVTQAFGSVKGAVVGYKGDLAPGATADVHQKATTVEYGATMTGYEGDAGYQK